MSCQKNSFCNIKDINNYKDLLINKKFRDTFYKQITLIETECFDCQWKKVCNGGCMGLNYEQDNNYKKINKRNCEYTKELLYGIYDLIKEIDIDNSNYNPLFIDLLKKYNYISLSEAKQKENNFNLLFQNKERILFND